MYHDGQWGTICDENWTKENADVVCKELGYKTALYPIKNAYFGEGSGKVRFKLSTSLLRILAIFGNFLKPSNE